MYHLYRHTDHVSEAVRFGNRHIWIIRLSLSLLSLVLLTLLINHPAVRFQQVAPTLISLPDDARRSAALHRYGKLEMHRLPQGLTLHVAKSGDGLLRWQLPAPAGFDTLRLVGIVSVSKGSPQARPGQQARLIIYQPAADKPRNRLVAHWPDAVHRQHFDRPVTIHGPTLPLHIDLTLTSLSGQLIIHQLRVDGLASRPWIKVLRGLLLSVWIGLILWTGWCLTRPVALRPRLLIGAMLGLLLIGILVPPDVRQWLEDWLSRLLPSGPPLDSGWDVDAAGHFSLFAALTVLLFWTRADLGRWRLLGLFAALALATELMQLFVDGRQPDGYDVLIDLVGMGTGMLLVTVTHMVTHVFVSRQTH